MLPGRKRLGRPANDEAREDLHSVTFKADAETREAIEVLKAAVVAEGVHGPGAASTAIRRALIAAAAAVRSNPQR
jgi:hypothetical protein